MSDTLDARQDVSEVEKVFVRKPIAIGIGAAVLVAAAAIYWMSGDMSTASADPEHTPMAPDREEPFSEKPSAEIDPNARRTASAPSTHVRDDSVYDPNLPIKIRLDELAQRARDNASLSYDVGMAVGSCAGVRTDVAQVEAMVDQGTDGSIAAASRTLDHQDFCAGLTKEDFDAALAMLDRAAAEGLVEAQVNYADLAGVILAGREEYRFDAARQQNYRQKAMAYLQQAARDGNPAAYFNLSAAYKDGLIVPRDPGAAARNFREYLERSGQSSARDLKYLEQLEEAARTGG